MHRQPSEPFFVNGPDGQDFSNIFMGSNVNPAAEQHTIVVMWSLKDFCSQYICFEVDATTTFPAFEFKSIPDSSALKILVDLSSNKILYRAKKLSVSLVVHWRPPTIKTIRISSRIFGMTLWKPIPPFQTGPGSFIELWLAATFFDTAHVKALIWATESSLFNFAIYKQ